MDLPSEREQRRYLKALQRELRYDDTFEDETYVAPSRTQRFARSFGYWFVSYEDRLGPSVEYFETARPRGNDTYMADPPDEHDDLNPA